MRVVEWISSISSYQSKGHWMPWRSLLIALPWILSFALIASEAHWKANAAHEKADIAQETLEVARVFAFGGIGFAGTTSQEELAFRSILILPSDTAKQRLERLYLSGNPQAMSYALAGMRKLDRKRCAELIASARTSDATVHTMSGCIMTNEKLRKIADELDSGKYDPWLR
jgi:hypothetical protein